MAADADTTSADVLRRANSGASGGNRHSWAKGNKLTSGLPRRGPARCAAPGPKRVHNVDEIMARLSQALVQVMKRLPSVRFPDLMADAAGTQGPFHVPRWIWIPCEAPSSFPRWMAKFARGGCPGTAMLRDDSGNGGGRLSSPRNVLGDRLGVCSTEPKTGFFRDGCCNTNGEDVGSHTVCAVMTAAFLEFSKLWAAMPMPQFGFPGLRPGDRWCLCAPSLARSDGGGLCSPAWSCGPLANEGALEHYSLADLKRFALDLARLRPSHPARACPWGRESG